MTCQDLGIGAYPVRIQAFTGGVEMPVLVKAAASLHRAIFFQCAQELCG